MNLLSSLSAPASPLLIWAAPVPMPALRSVTREATPIAPRLDRANWEIEPDAEEIQELLAALQASLSDREESGGPETAAFIESYLETMGSPAVGQNAGELMVEVGQEYDIDPLLLLAIAGHETVYGTQGIGVNGMLGVGAYDDNPENAVNNAEFSGVETQIRKGAETFARLREKGGAGPQDSLEEQLLAANEAGWATDPNWHLGVMRHYREIQQAGPPAATASEQADKGGEAVEPMDWGYTSPEINPFTGDTNWNGWGLGWVNLALQNSGVTVPELQLPNSVEAYDALDMAGAWGEGEPEPGSVVFWEDGDRIRIGFVGPDGDSVRTTQEPDAEGRSLGEIDMPDPVLGWFAPPAGGTPSPTPVQPVEGSGEPVEGVDPSDPASFFITQNTTQWNPNARYSENGTNANCGPTSLAMAALAFGKLPPGTSKDDPQGMIDAVRIAMTGNDNVSQLTGTGDVNQGAEALGMSHHDVGSLTDVDAALDSGMMVVAGSVDHFVLITGRSADGGYIVNDPMYTGEPGVTKSAGEMQNWFVGGVAVGP